MLSTFVINKNKREKCQEYKNRRKERIKKHKQQQQTSTKQSS